METKLLQSEYIYNRTNREYIEVSLIETKFQENRQ
jgi:hypothetical protein